MRVTVNFNMPDDKEDFEIYAKAYDYYAALLDIKDLFRGRAKYQETNVELHEDCYERICSILNERGIDI
jgi:hypothetical protein